MMKPILARVFAPLALILMLAGVARAGEPFDRAAFQAAQAAGAPVLVEVSAPWCPTCRAQKPIIEGLAADPAFAALKVFVVDFDSRKDVLREFRVTTQSTLIAFKGADEVGRSTGDTDPRSIRALVARAL